MSGRGSRNWAGSERQVQAYLEQLAQVRHSAVGPGRQLATVLETYAIISHSRQGGAAGARLHHSTHVGHAQQHLKGFFTDLLPEGAEAGVFRDDVAPDELAGYCLHALQAAAGLASRDAIQRLVSVTMAGLQPPVPAGAAGTPGPGDQRLDPVALHACPGPDVRKGNRGAPSRRLHRCEVCQRRISLAGTMKGPGRKKQHAADRSDCFGLPDPFRVWLDRGR